MSCPLETGGRLSLFRRWGRGQSLRPEASPTEHAEVCLSQCSWSASGLVGQHRGFAVAPVPNRWESCGKPGLPQPLAEVRADRDLADGARESPAGGAGHESAQKPWEESWVFMNQSCRRQAGTLGRQRASVSRRVPARSRSPCPPGPEPCRLSRRGSSPLIYKHL